MKLNLSLLIQHKINDLPKKPWVDLAEICKSRKPIEGFSEETYGISCWFCEHFWTWDNKNWTCEVEGKERERKMREATLYTGQQKILEKDGV